MSLVRLRYLLAVGKLEDNNSASVLYFKFYSNASSVHKNNASFS